MVKIATLGPNAPLSLHAAAIYEGQLGEAAETDSFTSIKAVFGAVGEKSDYGIIPLESMVDGHVVQVLELLLQSSCVIVDELIVPVRYGCVARCDSAAHISTLYTTYGSRNDCSEFIATLAPTVVLHAACDAKDALDRIAAGDGQCGAIVPSWVLVKGSNSLIIDNVNDYADNAMRFVVIAEQEKPYREGPAYKTSMVILEADDRPGVLSDILTAFSSRGINLCSIMSRPTREHMGMYHFFVDCMGYVLSPVLQETITDIQKWGRVKLLGSYPCEQNDLERNVGARTLPDSIPCMRENPFRGSSAKPCVSVASGQGPYRNTRDALSRINLSAISGKRVLLKPNLGRIAEADSGIVTNPQVVAATIDVLRDAGAAHIAIGESPITGVNTIQAFEKSGMAAIAQERDCPCIDMDRRNPIEVAVRNGTAVSSLRVCADLFDFDIIVSIPVMKTHMHTVVTLAVKNMKGCLWRRSKVELHMLPRIPFMEDKPLNVAIADMASILQPHLSIIDGTIGLEGLGPSAGDPKPLDLVIVSDNAFAADSIACSIMGIDPETVPHLRIAAGRGYGSIDMKSFEILSPGWESLRQPFVPVPKNIAMKFPGAVILDEQSCSACQSTVMLFMKRYEKQLPEYFPGDKPVNIAIGKGHKGIPPGTICVGNCTRRFRDAGLYVPGCPPVASSILTAIEKSRKRTNG